jgi:hypothetical protein
MDIITLRVNYNGEYFSIYDSTNGDYKIMEIPDSTNNNLNNVVNYE